MSAKVTEAEYARLQDVAGPQRLGEWAREALLHATGRHALEEVLLAEFLALRTILLNLHFAVANGVAPSADTMRGFIAQADQDKRRQAQEHLTGQLPGRLR